MSLKTLFGTLAAALGPLRAHMQLTDHERQPIDAAIIALRDASDDVEGLIRDSIEEYLAERTQDEHKVPDYARDILARVEDIEAVLVRRGDLDNAPEEPDEDAPAEPEDLQGDIKDVAQEVDTQIPNIPASGETIVESEAGDNHPQESTIEPKEGSAIITGTDSGTLAAALETAEAGEQTGSATPKQKGSK